MDFSDAEQAFLERNHSAAMITLRPDGTPHAVRVGVAVVDGAVWSSGVPGRARNRHLRRDPRSTLFVYGSGYGYVTIESRVRIIEGPAAAEMNLRLFQVMQQGRADPDTLMWNGQPLALDRFLETMRAEQRLIYEFEPTRVYSFGLT